MGSSYEIDFDEVEVNVTQVRQGQRCLESSERRLQARGNGKERGLISLKKKLEVLLKEPGHIRGIAWRNRREGAREGSKRQSRPHPEDRKVPVPNQGRYLTYGRAVYLPCLPLIPAQYRLEHFRTTNNAREHLVRLPSHGGIMLGLRLTTPTVTNPPGTHLQKPRAMHTRNEHAAHDGEDRQGCTQVQHLSTSAGTAS